MDLTRQNLKFEISAPGAYWRISGSLVTISQFRVAFCRILVRNHSNENQFDLHENEHAINENSFSYEKFCTRIRFETEVEGTCRITKSYKLPL